ncbi:unnamed protein product [Bursaphelenchus xylophilus]|uniref:(pine wood nematode) hypothetical protein n=1 Tax=Bursaphelenchus xylophilus TaxID=6326 RepID=A0A1I7SS07_BURXY|nr:unnamed protein product [Bursaphelenchus xylophilus]CAG9105832.1 unnamed protein product [Bursaphelenchus xylophilus]
MPAEERRDEDPPSSRADTDQSKRMSRQIGRGHDDTLPATPGYKSVDKGGPESPGNESPESEDSSEMRVVPRQRSMAAAIPYHRSEFEVHTYQVATYRIHLSKFIEGMIKPSLFHLAKTVSNRCFLFLTLPIFLLGVSLIGPIYYKDQLQISVPFPSFLSGPDPTVAVRSLRSQVTVPFNSSNPEFDALKRTSSSEFGILLSTKNPFTNIISNSSLSTYDRLNYMIANLTVAHTVKSLTWDDICRENCDSDNLLMRNLRNGRALLKWPQSIVFDEENKQKRFSVANVFGGVEADGDNNINKANTIQMNLKLKEDLKTETYDQFDARLKSLLTNRFSDKEMRVYYWSMYNYIKEVVQMLNATHYRLFPFAALLVIFCVLVSFRMDSYRTRPFVGLQTGVVLVLSSFVGYAVQIAGAGQINALVFPAVFVISACGALLFFSLGQSWNRYSLAALHPAEKLAFIISWDGPCTLLTLLCVIAGSIIVALFAPLTLIQASFFTIAAGLTAVLIFGMLYMAVCWFWSGRREAEGLKWWQLGKKGDQQFNQKCVVDYDPSTAAMLHEKLADLKPNFASSVGKFSSSYGMRAISLCICVVFVTFAVLGLEHINVQMKEEDFVQSNSTSAQYLSKYKTAFPKYEEYVELIIDSPIDYYDKSRRAEIMKLMRQQLEDGYVDRIVSWIPDFEDFQRNTVYDVNPDTIIDVIKFLFLESDHYHRYASDIVIDKRRTQILRSRSYLELTEKGVKERQTLVKNILEKAEQFDLPVTVRTPLAFSLHHDVQVLNRFLLALIIEILSITALSFILILQPSISLCLLVNCSIISFGIIGYSSSLGIPLNAPTLTTLLMGNVYIAVMTIHFCYQFVNTGSRQQASIDRICYAFQCSLAPNVFSAIILGAFFFPLPVAVDAPVLMHVWKILIAVAVLSVLSMICVLPLLMITLTETIAKCFGKFHKICDKNGVFGVEHPSESIYYVQGSRQLKMLGYGHGGMLTIDRQTRQMILNPNRLPQPPPDYTMGGNMIVADLYPRRAERYRIREAGSETESRPASTRIPQSQESSRNHTPRHERRNRYQRPIEEDGEEQIYEEPDTPPPHRHRSYHTSPQARYIPRDSQGFRVEYPPDVDPIRQTWRQYTMDPHAFAYPYLSSPSSSRRFA